MLHWLAHILGLDNLSGPYYGWWSGAGSDLGEIAIVGAVIAAARKHNCHARGCWRLGKHPVQGTPFVTCRKHHPQLDDRAPTADEIAAHPRHW